MTDAEKLKKWAATWAQAQPELEAIRRREIAESDNDQTFALLEDAFNQALESTPLRVTSGLVEMQRHLAKLRKPSEKK
jgi:hypothetical protein